MFKIGEFSKIGQVSVHLLRHYDEIDLLKPATIDEWTNYRYYSATQLPQLNRILALKDMGLSLDQVRSILDNEVSAEEIRGMFALKKAQLEQSIQQDMLQVQSIEARLQRIDEGDHTGDYEITVSSLPEQHILGLREQFYDFAAAMRTMGQMFAAVAEAGMSDSIGNVVATLHNDGLPENNFDIEMGFFSTDNSTAPILMPDGRKLTTRLLPAVEKMATSVRVGIPKTAHVCRADLAHWIETNNYELAGNSREVFLVPPQPGKEDQTVMEIQFPIRPKEVRS